MTSTLGRNTRPTDRTYLSIREVLELLIGDYPDVTISKIRFLEARGLIHPERTPSGYRKFYQEDVDRLRWILRQQRENYLPLNVIKVRLEGGEISADSDSATQSLFDDQPFDEPPLEPTSITGSVPVLRGHPAEGNRTGRVATRTNLTVARDVHDDNTNEGVTPISAASDRRNAAMAPTQHVVATPSPQVQHAPVIAPVVTTPPVAPVVRPAVAPPGMSAPLSRDTPAGRYSLEELAAAVVADPEFIRELETYGLIAAREVGGIPCFDEDAVGISRLAYAFSGFGIEPRHLKSFQHAAVREAEVFGQVVMPLLRQRNPQAHTKAQDDLSELVRLGGALKSSFVQTELRRLTGG